MCPRLRFRWSMKQVSSVNETSLIGQQNKSRCPMRQQVCVYLGNQDGLRMQFQNESGAFLVIFVQTKSAVQLVGDEAASR